MYCPYRLIILMVFLFPQLLVAQKPAARPNIIYIMADDLGYADLSCYGRKDYQTPHLDKLCAQGVKFMNAYATAPVCTPTRVAFFTGRYPAREKVGLFEPIAEGAKDSLVGLSPSTPSVGSLLQKAGYATYLVGKWHLGYKPEFNPNKNGFDYFFGFKAGATDYISHLSPRGSPDLYENETPVSKDGYLTDLLGDKALELISRPHDKPFFLAMMFNASHWPWQGPNDKIYPSGSAEEWKKGGSAAIYANMVKSMDEAIGKIVKRIDDLGMANNTVIIFTSDNGGERYSDNGIYKGKKFQLWEGGIREPAILRWTGTLPEKSTSEQVVTTMDWTATILSLAGAKPHKNFPLDGIDIIPVINGNNPIIERTLYWRIFQRIRQNAVRDGKWKWVQDEKGEEFLFDLTADPSETTNLKEKNSDIFNRLKNKFRNWEKTVLVPITL